MNKQIAGIALIGTGGVAHMHAQGFQAQLRGKLLGAYSRNPANVTKFAAQYDIKAYESLEEILRDEAVDGVAILTPTPTHMPTAIQCLEAGKHVLLEKPVGVSTLEVETLLKVVEQTGQICMPSHNYIYSPEVQRAKEYITAGRFGRLSSMWLIYNQKHWPDMGAPGLTLRELCIHHVYAMLYLIGRPIRVSACGTNIFFSDPNAPDQLSIQAELANGCIVNLWGSFGVDDKTSNPWTVYYKVLGTEGGFTHSWNDIQFGEAAQPGWDLAGYRESFKYVQQYFLEECIGHNKPPLSTLKDTWDAFLILDAVEQAMEEKRWVEVAYRGEILDK